MDLVYPTELHSWKSVTTCNSNNQIILLIKHFLEQQKCYTSMSYTSKNMFIWCKERSSFNPLLFVLVTSFRRQSFTNSFFFFFGWQNQHLAEVSPYLWPWHWYSISTSLKTRLRLWPGLFSIIWITLKDQLKSPNTNSRKHTEFCRSRSVWSKFVLTGFLIFLQPGDGIKLHFKQQNSQIWTRHIHLKSEDRPACPFVDHPRTACVGD